MASHRQFTEAARIAALQVRKAKTAMKAGNPNPLEVFVTRDGMGYGWQIRRFGAVFVKGSIETYASVSQAREAGCDALTVHHAETVSA